MLVLIDYGMGNLKSFENLYSKLRIPVHVSSDAKVILQAKKLILPGVGHFNSGMKNLRESGLVSLLNEMVLGRNTPILGICLGMQLMTRHSEEGDVEGLGWIPAETVKLVAPAGEKLRVPHVGFNEVHVTSKNGHLFHEIEGDSYFYFTHSYKVVCDQTEVIMATSDYGSTFTCAVHSKNIFGVQFHPEKSHQRGVQLLKNFAELV